VAERALGKGEVGSSILLGGTIFQSESLFSAASAGMTLYRRGKIWWTEFEVGGQLYRRSTRETAKLRAMAAERRLLSESYDVKSLAKLHDMRLGQAITRYCETVLFKKPRSPNGALRGSVKNAVNYLRKSEQYFGRKTPLSYLCQPGVLADFNQMLLGSMKPISANKYLSNLRTVLNNAYAWGALPYRPKVTLNRVRWAKSRYLTDAEERRLMKVCPNRIRDLVAFILDTGARKEEALTLTWNQVDFRGRRRSSVRFIDTKNGESRIVPLPKRTAANLRKLKRTNGRRHKLVFVYPATRTLHGKDGDGILARKGDLSPISTFQKNWENARHEAGLDDCRLHDLRHTYASKLVRRGVPLVYVSRLLGHKTIAMTLRYSHFAATDLDAAVAVLD
jgi:integrase